jgi:signal transduction histidine kinase
MNVCKKQHFRQWTHNPDENNSSLKLNKLGNLISEQELNELIGELMDVLEVNYCVINDVGDYIFQNSTLTAAIGIPSMKASEIDPHSWEDCLNVMRRKEKQVKEEYYDGKYFLSIKYPIISENQAIGVIVLGIDITNRKKAEEQAKIAKERAEQANQAKTKFLSIMSHEIRGPVGNVISAVDFLKPGYKLSPEEYQRMVYGIEQSARQALEILKNTSHYLELDSENFEHRTGTVYLPDLLKKLEKENQPRAKEGVNFSCPPLKSATHRVEFDFIHARQILKIVIDNALKFTQSGSITLSTKLLAPNVLRFTLKDTGPGIQEDYLNNIFKTFLNPEILMSEKTYLKTGLKLPLALRIAELANGKLTIDSEVAVGTTVYLDMPYTAVEANEEWIALTEEKIENNNELNHATAILFPFSILLVEDDDMNAELELKMLKRLGCHVTWCNTAFKAIDTLRKKTFDLIFIDITLPDMTGVALADTIRYSIPETTRMVAVTSHSSNEDHQYFLNHGIMTVLGKPLTEKDFIEFFRGYVRMLDSNGQ